MFPNIESYVEQHQQTQKNARDRHSKHYRAYALTSRNVIKNSYCCLGAILSGKSTFIHKTQVWQHLKSHYPGTMQHETPMFIKLGVLPELLGKWYFREPVASISSTGNEQVEECARGDVMLLLQERGIWGINDLL